MKVVSTGTATIDFKVIKNPPKETKKEPKK
jgi:hypothetical protein